METVADIIKERDELRKAEYFAILWTKTTGKESESWIDENLFKTCEEASTYAGIELTQMECAEDTITSTIEKVKPI